MIKKVNIPKKYESRFLKQDYFEFSNKQLVLLYGCNGIGKSSLLTLLSGKDIKDERIDIFAYNTNVLFDGKKELTKAQKEYYKTTIEHSFKNEIPKIFYWKASKHAPLRKRNTNADNIDLEDVAMILDSSSHSEGESIELTFRRFLTKIPDDTDLVLIDELDSGLGANYVHTCGYILFDWLREHPKTQCFLSVNNYHWVWLFKEIYRMDIGKFQKIENYDEFWDITREIAIDVYNKEKNRTDTF